MSSAQYSDDEFVKVGSKEESEELMEFPKEDDGTLLLSTVQSHFPNAIGLKYKASSGAWRGLRAVDNKFDAPREGWGGIVYYVTEADARKRKVSENEDGTKKKAFKVLLQDIAVLGLPFSTTDVELKEYFEEGCGELSYYEVKKEHDSGKSRGFGFIRFKTEEGAKKALDGEHYLHGRRLDLRQKKDSPMKLFVGRIPSGTTKDDLYDYFSEFGDLKDTYIPEPFRGFGFITFVSTEVGNRVLAETHMFKGVRLNVDKGEESKSFNMKRGASRGGNRDGGNRDGGNRDGGNEQKTNNYTSRDYSSRDSNSKQTSNSDPNQELKNMLFQFLAKQN